MDGDNNNNDDDHDDDTDNNENSCNDLNGPPLTPSPSNPSDFYRHLDGLDKHAKFSGFGTAFLGNFAGNDGIPGERIVIGGLEEIRIVQIRNGFGNRLIFSRKADAQPNDGCSLRTPAGQYAELHFAGVDIDNDGRKELVIGDPYYGTEAGQLCVFNDELDGNALMYRLTGGGANGVLGKAVSSAGDINGDGKDDIAVGASFAASQSGKVFIFDSAGSGTRLLDTLVGESFSSKSFGSSIALQESDGSLLIADPKQATKGAVYRYAYDTTTHRMQQRQRFDGTVAGLEFGSSITTNCDFDADGVKDDFIIGSKIAESQTAAGKVDVYDGACMQPIFSFTGSRGRDYESGFGKATACGDYDHDGYDDILIGDDFDSLEDGLGFGRFMVYSGKDQQILFDYREQTWGACNPFNSGSQYSTWLGTHVAMHDFNNDGFSDLLVTAHGYNASAGNCSGRVRLIGNGTTMP